MKNLPNVIVKELEINYAGNKIRAATFGRSLWESDLYALANSVDNQQENLSQLKIFPNPTNDIINIDMSEIEFKNIKVRILNSLGAVVKMENLSNTNMLSISVSGLRNGVYFIEIQTDNQLLFGKFIKQ